MGFDELSKNLEKILKIRELKDQYTGLSDPEYEEYKKEDYPHDDEGVIVFSAEPQSAGNVRAFKGVTDQRIHFFTDGSLRTKKVKEFSYIDAGGFVNLIPVLLGQIGMAIIDASGYPKTAHQETRFLIIAPFRLLYPSEDDYKDLLDSYNATYDSNCVFKWASIPLSNIGCVGHNIRLELIDNTVGTDKDGLPYNLGSGDCVWYDLSASELTPEKLRSLSSRKARYYMNKLEWEGILNFLRTTQVQSHYSIAKDGTLLDIIKSRPSPHQKRYLQYLVGISKSFSLRPIYEARQKYNIPMLHLLRNLREGERTRAFVLEIDKDQVVFWYMRLREPKGSNAGMISLGDKFNGLIKVEIYIPEANKEDMKKNMYFTQLYDEISAKIYNSRFPIPYQDRRWLSSLYPTFLCEEVIKSAFLSNFSLAQILENIFRRL